MSDKTKKLLKSLALVLILLVSFIVVKRFPLRVLRAEVEGFGKAAPLAYIGLFTLLPIFFFPVPVLVLPAGILFGLKWGTVYTLIGAFLNAILMYYLSRFLARDMAQEFLHKKAPANIRTRLLSQNQKTLSAVFFILRLIPLVSYNLINYAAGLTKIKLGNYLLTTILGILPGTVAFLNAGDKSLDVKSPEFLMALVWLIVLTVLSGIFLRFYLKRSHED